MKLNLAEKFRNPKFYYFITTDNKVNIIGFGLAQIHHNNCDCFKLGQF